MSEFRVGRDRELDASRFRFGIVVARFNEEITERLLEGAVSLLREHGAGDDSLELLRVPGSFELPMGAARLARRGDVDAVVCLGALIQGETYHFQVLAHATTTAVQEVARETGIPVTFGVLTCGDQTQARARAGGERGNKGCEAALAALEMASAFAESAGS